MKTVKVKVGTPPDIFRAFINDEELHLVNGEATRDMPPGKHALTWFARGPAGSKFSVQITAPKEAEFKHEDTIDAGGKDGGIQWFRVDPV